ncbi:hypothetical protein [Maritalea myrionectae]|uniref:Uncharacterized protein n=1 Tax=Maritalea myrionectae TaxID=454601 RepID=A0A2R4M9W0_9HYPH|nr:hypothetical protein [Maritalea myrionectae]AVX02818.1 hypothetical protein MXMO3_00270 [Maritalea myrionectae]
MQRSTTRSLLLKYALVLGIIILVGIGPILLTLGAGMVAEANGCTLHEGYVNPCVIWGADRGDTLYEMGMMFWFSYFTLPFAAAAFFVWLIVFFLHVVLRILRRVVKRNA